MILLPEELFYLLFPLSLHLNTLATSCRSPCSQAASQHQGSSPPVNYHSHTHRRGERAEELRAVTRSNFLFEQYNYFWNGLFHPPNPVHHNTEASSSTYEGLSWMNGEKRKIEEHSSVLSTVSEEANKPMAIQQLSLLLFLFLSVHLNGVFFFCSAVSSRLHSADQKQQLMRMIIMPITTHEIFAKHTQNHENSFALPRTKSITHLGVLHLCQTLATSCSVPDSESSPFLTDKRRERANKKRNWMQNRYKIRNVYNFTRWLRTETLVGIRALGIGGPL